MNKIKKIKEILEKKYIDGIIIPSESINFYYFVGKDVEIPCFLIITKNDSYVVSNKKYEEYGINFGKFKSFYVKDLKKFIKNIKNFGFDGNIHGFKNISQDLDKIREIKYEKEIKKIKNSCKCLENLFEFVLENKIYEKKDFECYFEIKKWLAENKLLESFDPIVAYDGNASFIHGKMSNLKFSKICLLDLGIKKNKYCSDGTLTFAKDEKISYLCEKIKEIVDDVLACISTNTSFKEISKIAEENIKNISEKYGYFNFHSLGHGIGLKVHEYPFVHSKNEENIKNGMVFTIEPGVYFPKKYGIRFETAVFVKNGRGKKLLNIF